MRAPGGAGMEGEVRHSEIFLFDTEEVDIVEWSAETEVTRQFR